MGTGQRRCSLSPDAQEGSHDRESSGPSVDRAKVEKFCLNPSQIPSLFCSELMGSHVTSDKIQTPPAAAHRALGDRTLLASLTCLLPPSPCLLSPIGLLIFPQQCKIFPTSACLHLLPPPPGTACLRASPLTFLWPPGPPGTARVTLQPSHSSLPLSLVSPADTLHLLFTCFLTVSPAKTEVSRRQESVRVVHCCS